MKTYRAELLADAGCALGEGPIYDEERGGLYWVDISDNRIFYFDPISRRYLHTQLDRPIGSMVLTHRNRLLTALDDGFYLLDGLRYTPYCRMAEAMEENIRFNDGKCDPAGRFVAGTQVTPNNAEKGALFSCGEKGRYRVLAEKLGCSNGLAWTEDGRTLYHIDTLVEVPSRLWVYDYDPETGEVANPRIAKEYADEAAKGILMDGMTIDRDGNLWIAEWNGWGVGCWDPKTGEKIAWVDVPAEKVTCCCFGGRDFDTLYITTAAGAGQHAGGVFAAKVEAKGFPAVKFHE